MTVSVSMTFLFLIRWFLISKSVSMRRLRHNRFLTPMSMPMITIITMTMTMFLFCFLLFDHQVLYFISFFELFFKHFHHSLHLLFNSSCCFRLLRLWPVLSHYLLDPIFEIVVFACLHLVTAQLAVHRIEFISFDSHLFFVN